MRFCKASTRYHPVGFDRYLWGPYRYSLGFLFFYVEFGRRKGCSCPDDVSYDAVCSYCETLGG